MKAEYDIIRSFLLKASGHSLEDDKFYLVQARLLPIVKEEGLRDLSQLAQKIQNGSNLSLCRKVIEAMTVNETYFFRDKVPFDNIEKYIIPEILERNQKNKSFKIWCAASSTGQEPYSLAIILDQYNKQFSGWNIQICATDLSNQALETAQKGLYSHFEVQRGMPINYLLRYFSQHKDHWQINDYIKSKVQFKQFNLMDSFEHIGQFDLILCRNVMIYFNINQKKEVLRKFESCLTYNGFMIIGSSESLIGLNSKYQSHKESKHIYVIKK